MDAPTDPIAAAYAAPRSAVLTADAARRPSTAWWLYFAALALLLSFFLGKTAYAWATAGVPPWPARVGQLIAPLWLTWGLAGLYGYIRARRTGPCWLWQVYLVLSLMLLVLVLGLQSLLVFAPGQEPLNIGTVLGLIGSALVVPLPLALNRYVADYQRL